MSVSHLANNTVDCAVGFEVCFKPSDALPRVPKEKTTARIHDGRLTERTTLTEARFHSPKPVLSVLRRCMQIVQDGVTVIVQPTLTFFRPVESRPQKPSVLMTSEEAAAYLNVHPDTLRKWVRLGKIPRVPLPGAGKDFRFRRESLDEWAKGRELR